MKHRDILRLALEADVAPNTAKKALRDGPQKIRGRAGEKVAEAMVRLGFNAEAARSEPPPHAA